MSENLKKIKEITSSEYKYGFKTKIKEDRIPNGLNEEIIKKISFTLPFGSPSSRSEKNLLNKSKYFC